MGWKKLEKDKVVFSSQALAEKYRDMTPAPHDRDLKEWRMSRIKTAIEGGTFRGAEYASVLCKETGVEYRLNGKHTSNVLAEMNGSAPKNLTAKIERYECDTLEDVARLYATYDPRCSARSTGDINALFAACHPALEGVPARIINLCVTGITVGTARGEFIQSTPEQRCEKMLENIQFVLFCVKVVENHQPKEWRHLCRAPVFAAMYMTWQKAPQKAKEFWGLVLTGEGPSAASADRVLQRYLLSVSLRGGAMNGGSRGGGREMIAKCIHAWNAWRRGESTNLKYYSDKPVPSAA